MYDLYMSDGKILIPLLLSLLAGSSTVIGGFLSLYIKKFNKTYHRHYFWNGDYGYQSILILRSPFFDAPSRHAPILAIGDTFKC